MQSTELSKEREREIAREEWDDKQRYDWPPETDPDDEFPDEERVPGLVCGSCTKEIRDTQTGELRIASSFWE
jgi:hypothetical protein